MKEIFDELEPKLKELKPEVKEKALEITGKLLTERILSREDASRSAFPLCFFWW